MDSTRTTHTILPLTLALLLPACVLDTKLIDNPSTGADESASEAPQTDTGASDSDPSVTTGAPSGDTTDADTTDMPATSTTDAPETGGDTVGEQCVLQNLSFEWRVASNFDGTWGAPVDESCTVVSSTPEGSGLALVLDCPQHAMLHGQLELAIVSGPLPVIVPQAGESLDVYYQPLIDDFIASPHPDLLFLRREDVLLYAAGLGFFFGGDDEVAAAEHLAPLTVDVEPGPCPLVDNPDWNGAGDGFVCQREANALLRVTTPDDGPVDLVEAEVGTHHVETRIYTSHVLRARVGENCVDADLEGFAYSLALTVAP